MDPGKLVFAQLMDFVPRHDFDACVRRHGGDSRPRGFSCRDQFLCMAFAQLTFRESLRDIETCLRALERKLYHAGFRGKVSRSTLADANRAHDWHIFADFAQVLIGRARKLYADEPFGVELEQTVYALDSTTIDLCLSLFPWARFRRRKGAVKLHTLVDLRGNIPTFVRITHGKTHDVTVLDHLPIEPGAFYVMDRGYVDFQRLYRFTTCLAFFVTRAKRGLDFTRRARRQDDGIAERPNDRSRGPEDVAALPRPPAPCRVLRRRERPEVRVPDQQFHTACVDDRKTLQVSMAGRAVFQMDQTEFAYQSLLRNERQRGENSSVDRDQRLRARGHRQKGTRCRTQPQRNLANPQPDAFRENPYF